METRESDGGGKRNCSFQRVFGLLFTHVGLALLLVGYAVLGAAVFKAIEGPFETQERIMLAESRQRFLESMWNATTHEQPDNFTLWMERASTVLREYENTHARSVKHSTTDDVPPKWTFSGSLFFSCTVFTTIGYGNMAPETNGGRVFCMVYAFFGIPLLMLVLVDLGTLLARGTKFLYLKLFRPCITRRSGKISCFDTADKDGDMASEEAVKGVSIKRVPSQKANDRDENWATDYGGEAIVMENARGDHDGQDATDEDIEFDIPVLAIVAFGFLYICALAGLLSIWEDWDYFECFYFSFITLSTIGFGDLVPEHTKFTIAASFFILLGMTVMTMCITLSQSKIQHSLKWMGWRIGVKAKPKKDETKITAKSDA